MADLVTFPLDTAKVRLQIQNTATGPTVPNALALEVPVGKPRYTGMFGTLGTIVRQEGVRGMYAGLGAGLQRQLVFATIRIGLYEDVKNFYMDLLYDERVTSAPVLPRMLAGLTTGAISMSVAQPTDVVKIRMQAQGATGTKLYVGALQAYRHIYLTEGLRGLWKGYMPNVARNSLTNVTELVSYDLVKEAILSRQLMSDKLPCHVVSGFSAGFLATLVASPVDVVKTRYMNSLPGEYTGIFHCARSAYNERGIMAFYKGCVPSFLRFGTWNILMFVCFEQLKRSFTNTLHKPKQSPVHTETPGNV